MDTTNYSLNRLVENVKKHIEKYNYHVYKITNEYVLFSKDKLTISEVNKKRCELNGEIHHYYW